MEEAAHHLQREDILPAVVAHLEDARLHPRTLLLPIHVLHLSCNHRLQTSDVISKFDSIIGLYP